MAGEIASRRDTLSTAAQSPWRLRCITDSTRPRRVRPIQEATHRDHETSRARRRARRRRRRRPRRALRRAHRPARRRVSATTTPSVIVSVDRTGFHYTKPALGLVEWMPAMELGRRVSIKTVGYHPTNPTERATPSVLATTSLYDTTDGRLLALTEATFLTALRTGAASAVAIRRARGARCPRARCRRLRRTGRHPDPRDLAGAPHRTGPRPRRRRLGRGVARLAAALRRRRRGRRSRPTGRRLLAESDIVCTATSVDVDASPVIDDGAHRPWLHINAVGADFPGKRELPLSMLRRALVCPDVTAQCLLEGEAQQLDASTSSAPTSSAGRRSRGATRPRGPRSACSIPPDGRSRISSTAELVLDHAERIGAGVEIDLQPRPVDPYDPYEFLEYRVTTLGALVADRAQRDPDAPAVRSGDQQPHLGWARHPVRACSAARSRGAVSSPVTGWASGCTSRSIRWRRSMRCSGSAPCTCRSTPRQPSTQVTGLVRDAQCTRGTGRCQGSSHRRAARALRRRDRDRTGRAGRHRPHAGPAPVRRRPEDLAYLMYTSGSTGRPKGIAHTNRQWPRLRPPCRRALRPPRWRSVGQHRAAALRPVHLRALLCPHQRRRGAVRARALSAACRPAWPNSSRPNGRPSGTRCRPCWRCSPSEARSMRRDLSSLRWVLFGGEVIAPATVRR